MQTTLTPDEWKPLFLEQLRETGSVTASCKRVGIGRTTAYEHRAADEKFRTDWIETEEVALDELEQCLFERARDGWDEPVYYQGAPCGMVRKFDNRLGEFFLTRRRREKFSDKALMQSVESIAQSVRDFVAAAKAQDCEDGDTSVDDG